MQITVRAGDTSWYYSQLFQVPLILIETSNPDINVASLTIGQSLEIPGFIINEYNVQPGDSYWSIASRYQLPIDSIEILNPNVNPQNLQPGQTLLIPVKIQDLLVNDIDQYTYEKFIQDLILLQQVYPFIQQRYIGNSVLGKDIIELQIGAGSKQVHMNGSFHANEWITTPVLMKFINEYVLALTNGTAIRGLPMLPFYQQTQLSIVPMVNPDGVDLVVLGADAAGEFRESVLEINNQNTDFSDWKANIRGVDLNNQYPALWDVEAERKPTSPQPRDFPGYAPLTEPEAIAIAELTRDRDFSRINALHTQGEVIFWGFEGLEPPESLTIVTEFERVSGYIPIQYVDSYAGYKDWFIQEYRRPGFTLELGQGTNPLPISQFDEIYEETLGILIANLYL
ncbi:M14 family zinc carboxypeptidase [Oceanobacillus iheyensis]|uniref:Gamma-D-glutamyl-L-diamino acid endopeptidase I n=1 Tax=Oceanobacillus iheyensis (strain DSM 14371 / CIP 107618 / JCM 11309 / KCTC 3954 / HTE831) TaxID=221109 RepID=Q8EQG9_OCEIH|nr:M14 family metallopeptidase [Oceanobacillus iheyensis]BAC13687.1 gamma-D-glutamyl-L-diamino acid endopeptidase I [Oceanobacillus iheyensis HTE831]